MRILIVTATSFEIEPLRNELLLNKPKHQIDFLKTGVGAVQTCFHLLNQLNKNAYDLVINAGIAGAFDTNKHPIGAVLEIQKDRFGDLGAEFADGSFEDVFELGLAKDNQLYTNGWLANLDCGTEFPLVDALTVNKVSGSQQSALQLQRKYNADLESMEGAAVAYTCLNLKVPFRQIRSVSNKIENRDRSKWDIPLAIKSLNQKLHQIILKLDP
jgi:futalosine hydrolase